MGSSVPTLLEIQTVMRRGLLGNGDATIAATLGSALAPADRLSIYRNTSRTALTNALRLNFPAVQRLVGEDFFAAAADTFITHELPNTAWLDLYGEGFPKFLQRYKPATTLAYLSDIARRWLCSSCARCRAAGVFAAFGHRAVRPRAGVFHAASIGEPGVFALPCRRNLVRGAGAKR